MEKNKNILLWGQDCGFYGGVFRATEDLQKMFGKDRVFDSPISEGAMVGSAIGAAMVGLKPIVEIQFQGFSFLGMQQIFCHAARIRNRSRGRWSCPIVVRMPFGCGVKALEHHSESLETIYAHIPGIKVVAPSNPYDAKGLLTAAINSQDPVIFLEHKKIYRSFKQEIPEELYEVEIGKANVIFEGSDLTVITYGALVYETIQAINQLKQQKPNLKIELIDLRTIKPLDVNTIINSVKKTGKLLVISEAVKTHNIAAEIITLANELAFYHLKTPPSRLTAFDITVPFGQGEKYFLISQDRIKNKILEIINIRE